MKGTIKAHKAGHQLNRICKKNKDVYVSTQHISSPKVWNAKHTVRGKLFCLIVFVL